MTSSSAHSFAISARPRRALGPLAAALVASSFALGCAPAEDEPGERALPGGLPVALARAELWRAAPPAEGQGPADGGGPKVMCGERDLRVEGSSLEVSTAECDHAVLRQPALADLARGDELTVWVWWSTLDAPEPATGRLRLFLGPDEVWQESVAIPGRADLREVHVRSPADLPAGAPITFVVSNHGANAWTLGEVVVRKAE
ncbi:MAG TPA: hypothetical protein VFS43_09050 [Polyangiaceae bacterium]|nr:hypothetical protein [Polyangiaceae bacterium]